MHSVLRMSITYIRGCQVGLCSWCWLKAAEQAQLRARVSSGTQAEVAEQSFAPGG